jgi:multidrug efflux pump subunit AcrA (membrane-fusion protein)
MDKDKKTALIIAGVAITVLVLWILFRPTPVVVETATAEVGEMLVTVDGEGKTRFKDKVSVTAPVSGRMSRIRLREGDFIPKDYVLAQIDPNPILTRPPSETEDQRNTFAWKVYAPITGRLLRTIESNERFVQAGTPILEMGNPDTVEIVVDVLSTDALQVKPGAVVLIENDQNGDQLTARVRTVEPQAFTKVSALGVEEQRVNIVIDSIPKELSYGDNFHVDVRIIVWRGDGVLKVPSSALFRTGEDWNVFKVENGKAYTRKITVGHRNPVETEVLTGLTQGEIVVLHPSNQLADGVGVDEQ